MSYPNDTPEWDTLVSYMEEKGFERTQGDSGCQCHVGLEDPYWVLSETPMNPEYMLDDNAYEPGNLALWRSPMHEHEDKGAWVLLHEGDPTNMLVRLQEELAHLA